MLMFVVGIYSSLRVHMDSILFGWDIQTFVIWRGATHKTFWGPWHHISSWADLVSVEKLGGRETFFILNPYNYEKYLKMKMRWESLQLAGS